MEEDNLPPLIYEEESEEESEEEETVYNSVYNYVTSIIKILKRNKIENSVINQVIEQTNNMMDTLEENLPCCPICGKNVIDLEIEDSSQSSVAHDCEHLSFQ